MYDADAVDRLLLNLENNPLDEDGALAEVATVAGAINDALDEPGLDADKREERLRKWLHRLHWLAERAAARTRASSFSVTVGYPVNVSVSFTWPHDEN